MATVNQPPATIEPLQQTDQDVVTMVDDYWDQAQSALSLMPDGQHTLRELRAEAGRFYMGDQWDHVAPEGLVQLTLNKTQNAIGAVSAMQLEQPIRRTLSPRETGEPPVYVLSAHGAAKVAAMIARGEVLIQGVSPAQLQPNAPLDPVLGEQLQKLTQPGRDPVTGATVMPPLNDRDLYVVNDQMKAKALQTVLDAMWEQGYGAAVAREAQIMCTIFGDQAIGYQWDRWRHCSKYFAPNHANVGYDPTATWIHNAKSVLLQQYIPITEARLLWPQHKDKLERARQGDTLRRDAIAGEQVAVNFPATSWSHVNFRIEVVTVRTLWLRDTLYRPMTEAEAVRRKAVVEVFEQTVDPMGAPAFDPSTGQPLRAMVGYRLADVDVPTAPGEKNWPTVLASPRDPGAHVGVRQVQVLVEIDELLDDRECPYADVPMPWAKNMPVPYNPHGLGEPFKGRDTQVMLNLVATAIVNIIRNNAYPEQILPADLAEELEAIEATLYGHPGRTTKINPDKWMEYFGQRGTGEGFYVKPPAVAEALFRLFEITLVEHDKMMGHTLAVQGQTPHAGASGSLVRGLINQARGPMALKSATLQDAVHWLTRVEIDAIVNWLPDGEWDRYLGAYPAAVRDLLRQGARGMQYDIAIDVGHGSAKEERYQQAVQKRQMGGSFKTFLEETGHDNPDAEIMRVTEERQGSAAAAGAQTAGA